jgi:hypothetical protein
MLDGDASLIARAGVAARVPLQGCPSFGIASIGESKPSSIELARWCADRSLVWSGASLSLPSPTSAYFIPSWNAGA